MKPLSGKKGLIIGIANDKSIAYGCAQVCRDQGAELAVTYLNDKALPFVKPLAEDLGVRDDLVMPFDITREGEVEMVFETITRTWGQVDFVMHAMASATKAMTTTRLIDIPLYGFQLCHAGVLPLLSGGGKTQ